jgi:hypothetical protein
MPDEQRIREAIEAMRQAMETRQPHDFLQHVDAGFIGNNSGGNYGAGNSSGGNNGGGSEAAVDRALLGNILRAEVLRNDRIGVTLGPIDVQIQGNRATAHVVATLTGGAGGLLPERVAVYSIVSGWKRDGRDWICYNASWAQQL